MAKVPPARRGRPRKPAAPRVRRMPRNAQATDAFDAIIGAAVRVLEQSGVAGLTTNRIAEVAGVSVGTLYHYFANREAIIAALYARFLGEYSVLLPRVIDALPTAPVRDVMRQLVDATVEAFQRQPRIHAHLLELRSASGANAHIVEHLDVLRTGVAAWLLHRRFARDEAQAATVAFVIVNAFEGVVLAISRQPTAAPLREVGDVVTDMVATYLEALAVRIE